MDQEVFKVVEQMPRFPGCDDSDLSKKEADSCAKKLMLEYIYKNLQYPEEAQKQAVEGMVVIEFVVDKKGHIDNASIKRDIGAGCGEAAKKVVLSMNNMEEKWTPGYQRGRAVNVQYVLPVKFKLPTK